MPNRSIEECHVFLCFRKDFFEQLTAIMSRIRNSKLYLNYARFALLLGYRFASLCIEGPALKNRLKASPRNIQTPLAIPRLSGGAARCAHLHHGQNLLPKAAVRCMAIICITVGMRTCFMVLATSIFNNSLGPVVRKCSCRRCIALEGDVGRIYRP